MNKPLTSQTVTLAAAVLVNGQVQPGVNVSHLAGSMFYCKTANAAFQMSLNDQQTFDWDQGFEVVNTPFTKLTFFNPNFFPLTITFYVGQEQVSYVGTNDQKVAATFALGNLGLGHTFLTAPRAKTAAGVGITLPGAGVIGNLNAAQGNFPANECALFVSGLYQGHRRKQIVFSVNGDTGKDLVILDSAGNFFLYIRAALGSADKTIETSSDFYLFGHDGDSNLVSIAETYYAS